MCTIREGTNSFAELCDWIRDLSNSIKELTNTPTRLQYEKNIGIRELFNSITELSNWITELSNSFKDKLI